VLPEGDVFLGPVPLIPYQTPGTREMGAALRPFVADHVAAILQNHGVVTWAADLASAYVRAETVEAVCRVVYQARLAGELKLIPAARQAELAAIRAKLRAAERSG
jgi:L-fuculose-phosphate aldolase